MRLFEWLVSAVNRSLVDSDPATGGGGGAERFIGLLDVFGFEFFGTNNSFEQLAINFANEKLQQFFLKYVFKAEEAEYATESVRYTPVEYQDNQGCIDLIEKSPTGIMRILDETCKKPNSNDNAFVDGVFQTHQRNDFYMEPRVAGHREYRSNEAFVVRHFAGDVCYFAKGFVTSFLEQGVLDISKGKIELAEGMRIDDVDFPASVETLVRLRARASPNPTPNLNPNPNPDPSSNPNQITARIDRLPLADQMLLKVGQGGP